MEQLRIVPILMLFVGTLFVYAGIKDQSPTDILKSVLGGGATSNTGVYGPNVNTNYSGVTNAGVLAYNAPSSTLNVGAF
jgi:hypothetical protein